MKRRFNERISQELLKYSPTANEYSIGELLKIRKECVKLAENCQIFQMRSQMNDDFATYRAAQ